MAITIDYKGWKFLFEKFPNSADIEAKFEAYVRATSLNLPVPVPRALDRAEGPRPADDLLGRRVELWTSSVDSDLAGIFAARGAEEGEGGDAPIFALVCDLRASESFDDLDALFEIVQSRLKSLTRCGRIVLVSRRYDEVSTEVGRGVVRALDGFARSVAREIGVRGITVNRIEVGADAGPRLSAVLDFVVSVHSGYMNAQVLEVTTTAQSSAFEPGAPGQRLAGKTAVVTGAARGIGRATGIGFALEGAEVIWADLPSNNPYGLPGSEQLLNSLVEEFGGKALLVDVGAEDAPQTIADAVAEMGGAHIVMNNAGIADDAMLFSMTRESFERVIHVNLRAPNLIVQELMRRGLVHDDGRLLWVASVAGISGGEGMLNYSSSKAGLIGVGSAWAAKVADRGITSNVIAAGTTETSMLQRVPSWMRDIGVRMNALAQVGQPVDSANVATFLSLPEAHGITGACIRVCGASMQGR